MHRQHGSRGSGPPPNHSHSKLLNQLHAGNIGNLNLKRRSEGHPTGLDIQSHRQSTPAPNGNNAEADLPRAAVSSTKRSKFGHWDASASDSTSTLRSVSSSQSSLQPEDKVFGDIQSGTISSNPQTRASDGHSPNQFAPEKSSAAQSPDSLVHASSKTHISQSKDKNDFRHARLLGRSSASRPSLNELGPHEMKNAIRDFEMKNPTGPVPSDRTRRHEVEKIFKNDQRSLVETISRLPAPRTWERDKLNSASLSWPEIISSAFTTRLDGPRKTIRIEPPEKPLNTNRMSKMLCSQHSPRPSNSPVDPIRPSTERTLFQPAFDPNCCPQPYPKKPFSRQLAHGNSSIDPWNLKDDDIMLLKEQVKTRQSDQLARGSGSPAPGIASTQVKIISSRQTRLEQEKTAHEVSTIRSTDLSQAHVESMSDREFETIKQLRAFSSIVDDDENVGTSGAGESPPKPSLIARERDDGNAQVSARAEGKPEIQTIPQSLCRQVQSKGISQNGSVNAFDTEVQGALKNRQTAYDQFAQPSTVFSKRSCTNSIGRNASTKRSEKDGRGTKHRFMGRKDYGDGSIKYEDLMGSDQLLLHLRASGLPPREIQMRWQQATGKSRTVDTLRQRGKLLERRLTESIEGCGDTNRIPPSNHSGNRKSSEVPRRNSPLFVDNSWSEASAIDSTFSIERDASTNQEVIETEAGLRPTTGGKTLTPQATAYLLAAIEEAERNQNDAETDMDIEEDQEAVESEREPSPFSAEDYVHFVYDIERQDCPAGISPNDVEATQYGRAFTSIKQANEAALEEFRVNRKVDVWPLRSHSWEEDSQGLAHWTGKSEAGEVHVRVKRSLRSFADKKMPQSKEEWMPKTIYAVFEKTIVYEQHPGSTDGERDIKSKNASSACDGGEAEGVQAQLNGERESIEDAATYYEHVESSKRQENLNDLFEGPVEEDHEEEIEFNDIQKTSGEEEAADTASDKKCRQEQSVSNQHGSNNTHQSNSAAFPSPPDVAPPARSVVSEDIKVIDWAYTIRDMANQAASRQFLGAKARANPRASRRMDDIVAAQKTQERIVSGLAEGKKCYCESFEADCKIVTIYVEAGTLKGARNI